MKPATNIHHFLILVLALTNAATASTIIYQDSFSRTGNLNGTQPDVVNTGATTWIASVTGTPDTTDGSRALNESGHAAFLPFVPQPGFVYTLSADLDTTSVDNFWESLGFSPTNVTESGAFHIINNQVGPWLLQTGDGISVDSAFLGPQTADQHDASGGSGLTGSTNYAITLDTQNPQWTVTFYRNGLILPGTATYPFTTNPTINYVGIGNSTVLGYVDNFTLSVVPEPSSVALLGIGMAGLLRRVRRRAK